MTEPFTTPSGFPPSLMVVHALSPQELRMVKGPLIHNDVFKVGILGVNLADGILTRRPLV